MVMDKNYSQHIDARTAQGPSTQDVALDSDVTDAESQIMASRAALQLSPTPSADPDDPLNWPMWWKIAILTQTSLLAAVGGLNTAMINPALLQLSREFNIGKVDAAYQTTVCIALNGIAPWLWIPLAYKFGRRLIYLATTLLAFISILSCAFTQTYAQLLIARIFNGFFPVGFALGATTVTDLFFFHQRGRAMGFFTVTVVNGSHLAPIMGGLIGQYLGWRWIFKFLAIVDGVLLAVAFFCLPETMYHRNRPNQRPGVKHVSHKPNTSHIHTNKPTSRPLDWSSAAISPVSSAEGIVTIRQPRSKLQTYLYYVRLYSSNPDYKLNYMSTITPVLRLFSSPTAVFPAIYYASLYGFASILPAITAAVIFSEFFHWNTLTIGLAYGGALTTGGVLGELLAGWVCDAVVKREQKRVQMASISTGATQAKIRPEVRLRPIWPGAILTPTGLLIYGFTIHYHTHPAVPLFGMGLSCFGLQIITTCTYTYAIDCHTNNINAINKTIIPTTTTTMATAAATTAGATTAVADDRVGTPASSLPGSTTTTTTTASPNNKTSFTIISKGTPSAEETDLTSAAVAQVAQLFNFIRQMFGFTFAFYVIRMAERIGYQWTFAIFAFCGGVLAFIPIVWLIVRSKRRGPRWTE